MKKRYAVKVNGQTLVDHFTSRELDVKVREDQNSPQDVENLYDVIWKDGLAFKMNDANLSGELKGAIDVRDGNAKSPLADKEFSYRGIPYYIQRLDNFVQEFAIQLNEVYGEGVDIDGNKGSFIFGFDGMSEEQIKTAIEDIYGADPTAENIEEFYKENLKAINFSVNQDILEDPSTIRTTKDVDKLPGGNDLMLDLMNQKHNRKMFKEGEPNDYMISIFSELGINAKEANMYSSSQSNMVNVIENQRLSISQVDQSEEMLSLIKYQQAYQAAARIITTMDTIYDITINRMGIS